MKYMHFDYQMFITRSSQQMISLLNGTSASQIHHSLETNKQPKMTSKQSNGLTVSLNGKSTSQMIINFFTKT